MLKSIGSECGGTSTSVAKSEGLLPSPPGVGTCFIEAHPAAQFAWTHQRMRTGIARNFIALSISQEFFLGSLENTHFDFIYPNKLEVGLNPGGADSCVKRKIRQVLTSTD